MVQQLRRGGLSRGRYTVVVALCFDEDMRYLVMAELRHISLDNHP